MEFQERQVDFGEAERRYAELKRQREAGTITDEQFDEQRRQLMVLDDEGRWWAKSRESGRWHYYDGSAWVPGTPPAPQPSQTPTAEGTTEHHSQPGRTEPHPSPAGQAGDRRPLHSQAGQQQDTQPPPPQSTPPAGSATPGRVGEKRPWRVAPRWIVIAGVALVAVLVLAIVGGVVAYRSLYPPVPDLVGQTESAAKQSAGEDFEVKVGDKQPSDKPKETVLSQDPAASERARRGSTISVVTSAGGDIFHDDFSSASGWPTGKTDDGSVTDYYSGGYRIQNAPPPGFLARGPSALGTVKDAIVEVDTNPDVVATTGDKLPVWGVICRAVDRKNYYFLGVTGDGSPRIGKLKDDKASDLVKGDPSDALKNAKTNHIRGDCVGNKLTLYINDQKVLETSDSDFDSGIPGLFVYNNIDKGAGSGTVVSFDNFLVSNPTSSGTRL